MIAFKTFETAYDPQAMRTLSWREKPEAWRQQREALRQQAQAFMNQAIDEQNVIAVNEFLESSLFSITVWYRTL